MKVKALSCYQPYAWMIVNGYIDIDDRSKPFSHRGILAIHASRRLHTPYYLFVKHVLKVPIPDADKLDYGAIVGTVELIDCIPPGAPTAVPPQRRAHGGADCYGLVFQNAKRVSPIATRGMPGLFDVDLPAQIATPSDQSNLF